MENAHLKVITAALELLRQLRIDFDGSFFCFVSNTSDGQWSRINFIKIVKRVLKKSTRSFGLFSLSLYMYVYF